MSPAEGVAGLWVGRKDNCAKLLLDLVLVTSAGCFVLTGVSRSVLVLGTPLAGLLLCRATWIAQSLRY